MENTQHDTAPVKGVIFDYGGTIDCRGDHWAVILRRAYSRLPMAELALDDFIEAYVYAERELARHPHIKPGHNFLDMLRIKARIELEYLADKKLVDPACIAEYGENIAQYCYEHARTCIADARPALDYLYGRYPMVLVSNFYGNIAAVLADFGLSRYFGTIVESAVVGVRKPDPRIFELGVEALGLKPEEVLVVGDSLSKDIIPAESIGCRTAWIKGEPWFRDTDEVDRPGTIHSLDELRGLY
ncbi:MAG: HAD family hydrolase [Muribaculaceae bacterium]|nr:HAD family hydrolase [Muribaculaceae bacterium]